MATDGRLTQLRDQSPLLTSLEAAVWLRLVEPEARADDRAGAVRAVHRLVQQCRLRPVRPGKAYEFAIAELERFVANETAGWKAPENAAGTKP